MPRVSNSNQCGCLNQHCRQHNSVHNLNRVCYISIYCYILCSNGDQLPCFDRSSYNRNLQALYNCLPSSRGIANLQCIPNYHPSRRRLRCNFGSFYPRRRCGCFLNRPYDHSQDYSYPILHSSPRPDYADHLPYSSYHYYLLCSGTIPNWSRFLRKVCWRQCLCCRYWNRCPKCQFGFQYG